MPNNAALAISAERQFLRRMVTGLTAAGGAVQSAESLQEAYPLLQDAQVVFYHATTYPDPSIQKLSSVLKGGRRLVVLLPRPGISDMLEPLSLDPVTSVASVGAADGATLAGIASRSFYGNSYGLERYLPYGVRAHAMLIGNYHEKAVGMGSIAAFARSMNVRRKYLEDIERVADELLMNALYDAPLVAAQLGIIDGPGDGEGVEQDRLVLQYACDGERFALSVTDHYGALQKSTLIEYVRRCLTSARPLLQESGAGAGLGLYLVCHSVSQLIVNVSQGVATEVVALFDLRAPKIRLTHISFGTERADESRVPVFAAGQRRARPVANGARTATPLSVKLVLATVMIVLLCAGALALYYALAPKPRGHLLISTDPPGVRVSVNGTLRGDSPGGGQGLLVANLEVGRHTIVASKPGYYVHDPVVATVRAGRRSRVTIRLRRMPAALKVLSSPPGAKVLLDDRPQGKTPLVLRDLEPTRRYRVTLAMPGYVTERRAVVAPAPGTADAEVFQLRHSRDWGALWLQANVAVEEVLLDGISVGLKLPLNGFRVAVGKHTVQLKSQRPYLNHRLQFSVPKAGHEERRELAFGWLRPEGKHARVFWDGQYRDHDILAPVGQYTLRVRHARTGAVGQRPVLIRKGQVALVRF
ncbi:MAG: PEGA domain-containing protein [bacterium]